MPFTIAVTIIIFTTIANNILPILESRYALVMRQLKLIDLK